jgi:hypothetical protein
VEFPALAQEQNNNADALTLRQERVDLRGLEAEQLRLLYDQYVPALAIQPLVAIIIAWL